MTQNALVEAFHTQSKACANLDSPFMERLCGLLAERLPEEGPVWEMIRRWPGDVSPYGDSVPLRLAGAFHGLVRSGTVSALSAVYPPNDAKVSDNDLFDALCQAAELEEVYILERLKSAPQTNEVRRAGMLLPGFFEIARRTGMNELVTSELGASAGLNLYWDHYGYRLGDNRWGEDDAHVLLEPDCEGALPDPMDLSVRSRAACDLNPINLKDPKEQEKLLSYLWPDQTERIRKTEAAIAYAAAQDEAIARSDAVDWLAKRLGERHERAVHVIYHTIAWQYFPEDKQKEGKTLLEAAGMQATDKTPLAWLRLEADGQRPGAALTLTLWPGGESTVLARGDFHGRWIKWI